MFKHFEMNTVGRDFVVGDIHGEFGKLSQALVAIGFDGRVDRLFSVGDLVDRGPYSGQVERWLGYTWFHAVSGNHESMTIDAINMGEDSQEALMHYINGGKWLAGMPTTEKQELAIMLSELPLAIEVETQYGLVGIVHAECPLQDWNLFKSLYECNKEYFTQVAHWSRQKISCNSDGDVTGLYKMYVGHTVVDRPAQLGNVHYIDTGACFGARPLTLVKIN